MHILSSLLQWISQYHPKMFLVSGFGAALLYSRWGKDAVGIYIPRDLIKTFGFKAYRNTQIEFILFVIVGAVIAVIAANPSTSRQAFAAGLGWTGLFTIPIDKSKEAGNDVVVQA